MAAYIYITSMISYVYETSRKIVSYECSLHILPCISDWCMLGPSEVASGPESNRPAVDCEPVALKVGSRDLQGSSRGFHGIPSKKGNNSFSLISSACNTTTEFKPSWVFMHKEASISKILIRRSTGTTSHEKGVLWSNWCQLSGLWWEKLGRATALIYSI